MTKLFLVSTSFFMGTLFIGCNSSGTSTPAASEATEKTATSETPEYFLLRPVLKKPMAIPMP